MAPEDISYENYLFKPQIDKVNSIQLIARNIYQYLDVDDMVNLRRVNKMSYDLITDPFMFIKRFEGLGLEPNINSLKEPLNEKRDSLNFPEFKRQLTLVLMRMEKRIANSPFDYKESEIFGMMINFSAYMNFDYSAEIICSAANFSWEHTYVGMNGIHVASMESANDVLALLCSAADSETIDKADSEGFTPLHLAVMHQNTEGALFLLGLTEDPNISEGMGWTALHLAAYHNDVEVVKKLLLHPKIQPTQPTMDEEEAIHLASRKNNIEIVKLLLPFYDQEYPRDHPGRTPVYYATKYQHLQLLELLLQHNMKNAHAGDHKLITPLHLASKHAPLEMVQLLVKYGANPNEKDIKEKTAIHNACIFNRLEIVQFLVPITIFPLAPCVDGTTAIHISAHRGLADVLLELLKITDDPLPTDDHGRSPLHHGARYGGIEVVKMLAKKTTCPNAVDGKGQSPIHHSALGQDLEVTEFLLTCPDSVQPWEHVSVRGPTEAIVQGENNQQQPPPKRLHLARAVLPDLQDNNGHTPIHFGVFRGHLLIVEALLKFSRDPMTKDNVGWTAMHECVRRNRLDIIRAIAQRCQALKISINQPSARGVTPLHLAAHNGYGHIVEFFLGFVVDVDMTDDRNQTARSLAFAAGHQDIVETLDRHMINPNLLEAP